MKLGITAQKLESPWYIHLSKKCLPTLLNVLLHTKMYCKRTFKVYSDISLTPHTLTLEPFDCSTKQWQ